MFQGSILINNLFWVYSKNGVIDYGHVNAWFIEPLPYARLQYNSLTDDVDFGVHKT